MCLLACLLACLSACLLVCLPARRVARASHARSLHARLPLTRVRLSPLPPQMAAAKRAAYSAYVAAAVRTGTVPGVFPHALRSFSSAASPLFAATSPLRAAVGYYSRGLSALSAASAPSAPLPATASSSSSDASDAAGALRVRPEREGVQTNDPNSNPYLWETKPRTSR